jgi:hypothetical protein
LASSKSCRIGIRPGGAELDASAARCKLCNRASNSATVETFFAGDFIMIARL